MKNVLTCLIRISALGVFGLSALLIENQTFGMTTESKNDRGASDSGSQLSSEEVYVNLPLVGASEIAALRAIAQKMYLADDSFLELAEIDGCNEFVEAADLWDRVVKHPLHTSSDLVYAIKIHVLAGLSKRADELSAMLKKDIRLSPAALEKLAVGFRDDGFDSPAKILETKKDVSAATAAATSDASSAM